MDSPDVLLTTDFKDVALYKRGKVRDVYDLTDRLLIVSTDRISCFDVVLGCGIPHKGEVLTQLSGFWFNLLQPIAAHHCITSDVRAYPPELKKYNKQLTGRSMLVKKTRSLPVECVVRGYLSGSGWKEYQASRSVCGIPLPAGLRESDKLPEPIFTPSTKEDVGHDMNVTQAHIEKTVGKDTAARLREMSLAMYRQASAYADERGIIIADTKFEFGIYDGEIIVIDEALTPDSSRFWPKTGYQPGQPQMSFDKQFVRDYLESLGWDKNPPPPRIPDEIILKTSGKYLEAYQRLTGKSIEGA